MMLKRMRKISGGLLLALLIAVTPVASLARASVDEAAKYKLHAVFLYNFISSIEWPKTLYSGDIRVVDLCIVGEDTLGVVMDAVAKKAASAKVQINIRRGVTNGDVASCNIAYISRSEKGNMGAILAKAKESAVLTVSENAGGIIEFVLKGTNVSFKINNKDARKQGLVISPQLLEVASEVVD